MSSGLTSMRWLALCLVAAVLGTAVSRTGVHARQTPPAQKPSPPQVGQPGKDVEWVPTPRALVDAMLDMAKVTSEDYLIDLGSGDGVTVITAARRGTRALGIEYDPELVELSARKAAEAGVSHKATFVKADLFQTDFSQASVITMFLLPALNIKLRPTLLNLKPGTRVVSNTFTMEDWRPDETATIKDCTTWCTALMWIIPAKVEGTWRLPQGELKLSQQFQMLSGTLGSTPVSGRIRGDQVTFSAGNLTYDGRVNGNVMRGSSTGGNDWTAELANFPTETRYVPQVYQAGKDVEWVPTPQPLVEKMLTLAKVTPQDYLIDLGSGDGRVVIGAARRGTNALGIEYNPDLVALSARNAAEAGVSHKAAFVKGDLFETDFSQASVVTLFLMPALNLNLRPTLLNMKPGTRIVSNTWTMGNWQSDGFATLDDPCTGWCMAFLWIVPAKVDGTWRFRGGELKLTQQFQVISGTLGEAPVSGTVRGDQVTFWTPKERYSGRVNGNVMRGSMTGSGGKSWTARRR